MSEQEMHTETRSRRKDAENEPTEPVHMVRRGAIAASVWRRQSPSGYAYYDFSLSRSWKSMSSEKTGYSRNFFDTNQEELVEVITRAAEWIATQKALEPDKPGLLAA